MNTKSVKIAYQLSNWMKLIHDRESSGLNIKDYCENIGMARHVYYYRLRKVRDAACEELAMAQSITNNPALGLLTEVKLSEPTSSADIHTNTSNPLRNNVCFEVSGLRLTAGSEYPIEKLSELLRVVSCL